MPSHFISISKFSKIAGTICLIATLSGCVPAALVIGATAGGAIVYDRRNMSTMTDDQNAKAQAEMNITDTSELQQNTRINIAVFDHILLLVGQVPTEELRTLATQQVSNIPHVSRVYNEITIQNPISITQRSKDSWITAKVRTEMLAKKGLSSTDIKVITENSIVYLMGIVTPHQADLAIEVARHVNGVQKVVKIFENQQ